jgi:opacity protein-like surface antigen
MRNSPACAVPIRVFPAALALLALAARTSGQEVYGPDKSDYLIGFDATYRHSRADAVSSSSDETELFQARVQFGWFYSRRHELGLEFSPEFVQTEAGGDTTFLTLGPYYNYNHWAAPRTTLYGGPHLGLTYLDASGIDSDTALSWGVHGGVRYWISPNVSVNVEPRFTVADQEDDFGGETTNIDVLFGIEFKL